MSAAGGAGSVPLDGRPLTSLAVQVERDEPAAGEPPRDGAPHANLRVASPGYFSALGQRVVEGRTFTRADSGAEAMVVVINQSLARKHWPAGGAVGQRMRVQAASATVVGVVEDTRQALDQPASDEIYLPLLVTTQLSTNWLVRSALPSDRIERQVRGIVRGMDPTQPVDNFRSLESFRADLLMPSRVIATVIGLFAALALTITGTGIAGVVGFAVQHRRREFGVRLALGAPRHRVVGMVLADAMRLVLTGLAMGVLGSIVAFPFLRARLSGIETLEVLPVAVVSAVLLGVAAAAAFVPARRAATVDPMITLRVS